MVGERGSHCFLAWFSRSFPGLHGLLSVPLGVALLVFFASFESVENSGKTTHLFGFRRVGGVLFAHVVGLVLGVMRVPSEW